MAASAPEGLVLPRVKLFLALSRTHHGLLDLAAPGVAALLCLGALPSPGVTALGLLTAFAGYTAVYALNDVVDYRGDREKFRQGGFRESADYLDAAAVRHPMAQGLLSLREGLLWTGGWALAALLGAYLLNPVCAYIFLAGCLLEAIYCSMLGVSHLRTQVSGVVKTLGGVAAVYAVNPQPSPLFLITLFLWLFFWEIGGQNIPADWVDFEEDRRVRAKTVPVQLGLEKAGKIILGSLGISAALSLALFLLTPARLSLLPLALALGASLYFLLLPARQLYRTRARRQAAILFTRASYYPVALLIVALISLMT